MKQTADGKQVPARCWYYLLEWNDDDNHKTIFEQYKTTRLHDLIQWQFWDLFRRATQSETS